MEDSFVYAGERTPNWPHSYGVLTGIRQGGMRPGLLYRAALEGATFSLVNGESPQSRDVLGVSGPRAFQNTAIPACCSFVPQLLRPRPFTVGSLCSCTLLAAWHVGTW